MAFPDYGGDDYDERDDGALAGSGDWDEQDEEAADDVLGLSPAPARPSSQGAPLALASRILAPTSTPLRSIINTPILAPARPLAAVNAPRVSSSRLSKCCNAWIDENEEKNRFCTACGNVVETVAFTSETDFQGTTPVGQKEREDASAPHAGRFRDRRYDERVKARLHSLKFLCVDSHSAVSM